MSHTLWATHTFDANIETGRSALSLPYNMSPKTPPKTHFICLPLRTLSFRNKVTAFNALLPNTVPQSIIRPPGSLHFTLGVMSLTTPDEIESAVTFLRSCRTEAYSLVEGRTVTVRLKGIASMQPNVEKTNVIYAVPDESEGRLRLLCGNEMTHFPSNENRLRAIAL